MFESLQMAPPDAILGLTELFRKDPNPDKINIHRLNPVFLCSINSTILTILHSATEIWCQGKIVDINEQNVRPLA